jgi:hypothetical protein
MSRRTPTCDNEKEREREKAAERARSLLQYWQLHDKTLPEISRGSLQCILKFVFFQYSFLYTTLDIPQRKKFGHVKSGDRGGHRFFEMILASKEHLWGCAKTKLN